jgi:hypothetical protein
LWLLSGSLRPNYQLTGPDGSSIAADPLTAPAELSASVSAAGTYTVDFSSRGAMDSGSYVLRADVLVLGSGACAFGRPSELGSGRMIYDSFTVLDSPKTDPVRAAQIMSLPGWLPQNNVWLTQFHDASDGTSYESLSTKFPFAEAVFAAGSSAPLAVASHNQFTSCTVTVP